MCMYAMDLDDQILYIEKLLKERKSLLPSQRLFLITHNQWLRVYNNSIEKYEQNVELAFIRNLRPERGQLLNFFSKVEFLVNELIQARILGLFSERAYELDNLLEKVNFNAEIELLEKWGVINSGLEKRISKIKAVRNQLAHRWDEKEVFYDRDPTGNKLTIIENVDKFKQDAEKVWTNLIDIYMKEEEKEMGRVISKLDDPNTINIYQEMVEARNSYNDNSSI